MQTLWVAHQNVNCVPFIFIFNFFGKNILAVSLLQSHLSQGRRGAGSRTLPSTSEGLRSPTGDSLCEQLAFLKPLFILKKKPDGPRSGRSLRASLRPLPPASSSSLQAFWVCFCFQFGFFGGCLFSRDPTVSRCLL